MFEEFYLLIKCFVFTRSLKIVEALEIQMDVQKKLYEQIEVAFTNDDQYYFY